MQVADDRVDLGDGIQAWRQGRKLYIGYPARPYAELDTGSINSRWGHLGYDSVVFDDPGQHDGSTIVVGTVRGAPTSVRVAIDGVAAPATIACFSTRRRAGARTRPTSLPRSAVTTTDPQVDVR